MKMSHPSSVLGRRRQAVAEGCAKDLRAAVGRQWGDRIDAPNALVKEPHQDGETTDFLVVPLASVVAFLRDFDTPFAFGVENGLSPA